MRSASRHILAPASLAACGLPAAGRHGLGRLRDDAGHRGGEAGRIEAHPRGARAPPASASRTTTGSTTRGARSDDRLIPAALAGSNGRPQYEPCEECGAPLDPQQRYCVNCAARRGNGANPSSRYFAMMSKRAHRPPLRPPVKDGSGSRAAAVGFFALLPIAVAIGVVVGRSGNDSGENEALLEALRNRPAAVASTAAGHDGAPRTIRPKAAKAKAAAKAAKGGGKVVAKTSNGTVHEVSRLQTAAEEGRRRHQAGRRKPRTVGEQLHQGAAEPARRDRRRRRPQRSAGRRRRSGRTMSGLSEALQRPAKALRSARDKAAAPGGSRSNPSRSRRRTPSCSPSATACWRSSRSCRPTSAAPSTRWRSATTCGWTCSPARRPSCSGSTPSCWRSSGCSSCSAPTRPGSAPAAARPTAPRCASAPSAGSRW